MKKKILIIDDDLIYQEIIRKLLCKNYNLTLAKNSKEAIKYLGECSNPDLIIADLNMPGLHGLDLMLTLKENIDSEKTRILVISGMDDVNINVKLKDLGISEILTKPIDRKELKEKVNKLINEKTISK